MHNKWYLNEARVVGSFVGTVTRHESKYGPIATFSILTKEYKHKEGKLEAKTEFVPITAFGRLVDAAKYMVVNAKYMVVGKIVTTQYVKSGQKISRTTVVADEIIYIQDLPNPPRKYIPKVTSPDQDTTREKEENPYDILDEIFDKDDTVQSE